MTSRVALVTGASRGLGRQLAGGLLAEGFIVIGVARSPLDAWQGEGDDRFDRHVCDITDESMVKRLFSDIRKRHGRLDLLVNNAGTFSSDLLLTASAERFAALLRTNLVAAQVVTREAVKLMRPKGRGRVIGISSIAASIPMNGNALYATTKIALEALMRGFAVEFRGSGLTFNSIALSFLESTGMVDALQSAARSQYESRLLVPHPLGIDEIIHAVRFFDSDLAGSVTGQTITLGSPF